MDFTGLLILALLAFGIPAMMLLAQAILGPKVRSEVKDEPFECGQMPMRVARGGISVKFYQIAMLFLIFDLEIVFLWPWAVALAGPDGLGIGGLLVMGIFLGLLTLSYLYAWRKGVLEWES